MRGGRHDQRHEKRILQNRGDLGVHPASAGVFEVAGRFISGSDNTFVDSRNLLLLLKQSAPIAIIAIGSEPVVMINGQHRLVGGAPPTRMCGIVMLDSMSCPFMAEMGDGAIPLAWLFRGADGLCAGPDQRNDRLEDGRRRPTPPPLIVTLGAMLGYRGLVFHVTNGEQPTSHLNWGMVGLRQNGASPGCRRPPSRCWRWSWSSGW